jgi:hypothetical protein
MAVVDQLYRLSIVGCRRQNSPVGRVRCNAIGSKVCQHYIHSAPIVVGKGYNQPSKVKGFPRLYKSVLLVGS